MSKPVSKVNTNVKFQNANKLFNYESNYQLSSQLINIQKDAIIDFFNDAETHKSSISNTEHSDKDNININQIRDIIRDDKNTLIKKQETDVKKSIENAVMLKYGLSEADAQDFSEKCYRILLTYYNADSITSVLEANNGVLPPIDETYLTKKLRNKKLEYSSNKDIDANVVIEILLAYQSSVKDYTNVYNKYLEGKTLKQVCTTNPIESEINSLFELDKADEYGFKKFQCKQMTDFMQSNLGRSFGLSNDMMNSIITEIVDDRNTGYNAMVLELTNGNFAIVNSCTNPKESQDMTAILYAISRYACADEFAEDISKYILNPLLLSDSELETAQQYLNKNNTYEEDIYNGQIESCKNLIIKYAEVGKNMELYGYSLGGGIMEAAYEDILLESNFAKSMMPPEYEKLISGDGVYSILGSHDYSKYIKSVSVYNPFTLIAEEHSKAISLLSKDDKFLRYCAEGDVVSIFNDCSGELNDRTVYVKADSLSNRDLKITDLFSGGNHGFQSINSADDSSFDLYGNLSNDSLGNFCSLENVLRELDGQESLTQYNENFKPNYEVIIPALANQIPAIAELKENEEVAPLVDELIAYFGSNYGNIKYKSSSGESISKILSDYICDYAWEEAKDRCYGQNVANLIFNEDDFKADLKYTIKHKSDILYQMIGSYIKKDKVAYKSCVEDLVGSFMDDLRDDNPISSSVINWGAQIFNDGEKPYDTLEKTLLSKLNGLMK